MLYYFFHPFYIICLLRYVSISDSYNDDFKFSRGKTTNIIKLGKKSNLIFLWIKPVYMCLCILRIYYVNFSFKLRDVHAQIQKSNSCRYQIEPPGNVAYAPQAVNIIFRLQFCHYFSSPVMNRNWKIEEYNLFTAKHFKTFLVGDNFQVFLVFLQFIS